MSIRPQGKLPQNGVGGGYQPDAVRARSLIMGIIGLLVSLLAIQLAMLWLVDAFLGPRTVRAGSPSTVTDPSVVHWGAVWADFQELQRKEAVLMNRYDLLDPERNIARIPVDEAMRMLAANGEWPRWQVPAPARNETRDAP